MSKALAWIRKSKSDDDDIGLEAGESSHLVAWDDRRICRDEYFFVVQYTAT